MTPPPDSESYHQFRLRHLLAIMALVAVALAALAPAFRKLSHAGQVAAGLRSLLFFAAVIGLVAWILIRRARLERAAGPPIQRFERARSRILSWLIAGILLTWYALTVSTDELRPHVGGDFFPGSPYILFFAINYLVVRLWWRIDPAGIEARQRGLILGGRQLLAWGEINRYTWTGVPPRQLNLFLKQRTVLNLKVDPASAAPLGGILDAHLLG